MKNNKSKMDYPKNEMKFDFDDIAIEPAITSEIRSRKEINIHYYNDNTPYLPLIVAPMDTVISKKNINHFIVNRIPICIPRGSSLNNSEIKTDLPIFKSYSLEEFTEIYIGSYTFSYDTNISFVLIDSANGHMQKLVDVIKKSKSIHGDKLKLMVGNIANPETYKVLSEAGADYIRCGIGGGSGCLTSQQLGINFPNASLIKECYEISSTLDNPAKIVADGGFKKYSDIIKALALGADFVMLGGIFNKSLESCGDTYLFKHIKINQYSNFGKFIFDHKIPLYKKFRGMSTKEVQKEWGKETLTTSEGVVRYNKVEYTLDGWVINFIDYLRSAMSYTNSGYLKYFIGKVKYNRISQNSFNRFNK